MDCPMDVMWVDVQTKPLQGRAYREQRAKLMNCPVDYAEEDATTESHGTMNARGTSPPARSLQECVGRARSGTQGKGEIAADGTRRPRVRKVSIGDTGRALGRARILEGQAVSDTDTRGKITGTSRERRTARREAKRGGSGTAARRKFYGTDDVTKRRVSEGALRQ